MQVIGARGVLRVRLLPPGHKGYAVPPTSLHLAGGLYETAGIDVERHGVVETDTRHQPSTYISPLCWRCSCLRAAISCGLCARVTL